MLNLHKEQQSNLKVLKYFKSSIDKMVIRELIKSSLDNYKEDETYIIYDGNKIAIFDQNFLEIHKTFGHIKNFTISRPIR